VGRRRRYRARQDACMTLQTWLLFCATETVLCFTPGPAVLLVISLSLSRSARAGLRASLGILAANAVYFTLSATSLGPVPAPPWTLFFAIKWAGGGFLIWLGIQIIPSAPPPSKSSATSNGSSSPGAFRSGFIPQAANPKALIFFPALLPQFIDPATAVARQV